MSVAQALSIAIVDRQEYQRSNPHIFPSLDSLKWFLRKHRAELVDAGALLHLNGRPMINPEPMQQAILSIGGRHATERTPK